MISPNQGKEHSRALIMEREFVHKPTRRPLLFMFYFRLTCCYTFYSLRLRWDIGHSCSWQLFVCRRFFLDLPFLRISRSGSKKKKFKVRIIKILNIKKSTKGSYLVERHIEFSCSICRRKQTVFPSRTKLYKACS